MKLILQENLTSFDRSMRMTIGIILSLSVLIFPFEPAWIAAATFAAIYPLLSGLTAIDPLFAFAESITANQKTAVKVATQSAS